MEKEKIQNLFPNNEIYIKGECYLVWDKSSTITGYFEVNCNEIDDSLIYKARIDKNQLELIDGTIMHGFNFIINPMTPDNIHKKYSISSSPGDNNIVNIQIINNDPKINNKDNNDDDNKVKPTKK